MIEKIWLGNEHSYLQMIEAMSAEPHAAMFGRDTDQIDNPVNMEEVEGVAVLNISGPLISKPSFFSRVFGLISYEDIKEKMVEAGENSKVRSVLLNYDTPGGMAKGCKLCARFIREFGENVKPTFSFTEGDAASAGYWLYSSGLMGYADEDSRLGSIGAIVVHSELTKMDEKIGITRTVFRSAPYKALGNPFEKLTDEGKKEIQDEIGFLHDQFVTGISENRDIEKDEVNSKIANGKIFRADKALKLGMTDGILSLEETVAKLATQFAKKP